MSSTQVKTMRSPSQRTPPRTGPLAQSVDLQCPFDACSCLRQLRTWKSSQVLYYLPSRHNRRCNMAHDDQACIQSILRWCTETAIRLFVLVSVFLAIRVAVDVGLYICQLQLITSAPDVTERIPSPCHARTSIETAQRAAAVLQFVSDHIIHASSVATLTAGFTTRLHLLVAEDRVDMRALLPETSFARQRKGLYPSNVGINFTASRTPLIDFTPGGLIGKTFTYALDELDYLSASSSDYPCEEARVLAVYHRTASNLLLEYSAARQRIRQLVLDLRIIHRRLIAKASQRKGSHRTLRSLWRRSDHSSAYKEDDHSALASGLEAVIADLSLLAPYLDRMTDQLAHLNVPEKPTSTHKIDLSVSRNALRDLFTLSRVTPRKRWIFSASMNSSYATLKRVKVILPRSSTMRIAWWSPSMTS